MANEANEAFDFFKSLIELCGFYRVNNENAIEDKNGNLLYLGEFSGNNKLKLLAGRFLTVSSKCYNFSENATVQKVYLFGKNMSFENDKGEVAFIPLALDKNDNLFFTKNFINEWFWLHLEMVCAYLLKKMILSIMLSHYNNDYCNNFFQPTDIISIGDLKEVADIDLNNFISIKYKQDNQTCWAEEDLLRNQRISLSTKKILQCLYQKLFPNKIAIHPKRNLKSYSSISIAETFLKLKLVITLLAKLNFTEENYSKHPANRLQKHLNNFDSYLQYLSCVSRSSTDIYTENTTVFLLSLNGTKLSVDNIYGEALRPIYARINSTYYNELSRRSKMQLTYQTPFERTVKFYNAQKMPVINNDIPAAPIPVHQLEQNEARREMRTYEKKEIPAHIADVIQNYSPQAQRNVEKELEVIAKDKIEMCLMMTLQNEKERQKWLPGMAVNGTLLTYKGAAVNLNEHFHNQSALIAVLPKYKFSSQPQLPFGYVSNRIFTDLYGLINSCVDENNFFSEDKTIVQLKDKFNISKTNILAPVAVPDYSKWQPSDDVNIFYKYIYPGCSFISFNSQNGALIYGLLRVQQGNESRLLPITNWVKENENPASFFVMPQGKAPLLNLDIMANRPHANIIVTDDLELAYKHGVEYAMSDVIWTSWYGGKDAMKNVDWEPLKGRKVFYAFKEDGDNFKEQLKAGIELLKIFEEFPDTYLNIIAVNSNRVGKKLKHYDFIIQAKKSKINIPQKLKKLASHVNLDRKVKHKTQFVINDIIKEKNLVVLFAPAGAGKSWLTMSMALALSKGENVFSGWESPSEPRGVALICGEMTLEELEDRGTDLGKIYNANIDNILCPVPKSMELSEPESQMEIDNQIARFNNENDTKISLMILDNLNKLAHKATREDAWNRFYKWLEKKKEAGITTILVHHPNKTGAIHGTNQIMNSADLVLCAADKDIIKSRLLKLFGNKELQVKEKLKNIFSPGATMYLMFDKERNINLGNVQTTQISLKEIGTENIHWEVTQPGYGELLKAHGYSLDQFSKLFFSELETGKFTVPKQQKNNKPAKKNIPTGDNFKKLSTKKQGEIIEKIWLEHIKETRKSLSSSKLAKQLNVSKTLIDSVRKETNTRLGDLKTKYPEYNSNSTPG